MVTIRHTTRQYLGWELAGISFFHAAVLLWGAATWSSRLRDALEADYGELAPYVQANMPVRGAPVELILALVAALAGVGWMLLASRGRMPAYFDDWKGRAALVGGATVVLVYTVAAVVPLLIITNPREVERIPSWDGLGVWGDASFLLMFVVDALVVTWWTLERWRQTEDR